MSIFRADDGLTLIEVLIAMSITTVLTLGIGQMFSLGVRAMQYSEGAAASTVKKSNITRTFATDVSTSTSFFLASASPGTALQMKSVCTTWTSGTFTDVRPLITLEQSDSSLIGYEVRRVATGGGEIWRVRCASNNAAPTSTNQTLLLAGVAPPTAATTDPWANRFTCSGTVTTSVQFTSACAAYTTINSLTADLGIRFTIPSVGSAPLPVQAITGSRSGL